MRESPERRILCIDDTASEAELRLLKDVLERAGYRVLATRSAQEALEIVRNNEFDLVLTEYIVPKNDGPSLTHVLKRLRPHVPVALYSEAWVLPPDGIEMADKVITKLVSIDELLCTIEELLAKSETRAAA